MKGRKRRQEVRSRAMREEALYGQRGPGRGWHGERERHRQAALKGNHDVEDSRLLLRTLTKRLEGKRGVIDMSRGIKAYKEHFGALPKKGMRIASSGLGDTEVYERQLFGVVIFRRGRDVLVQWDEYSDFASLYDIWEVMPKEK